MKIDPLKVSAAVVLLLAAVDGRSAIRYVNVNNPTPAPPYLTWPTAATNIQDAVDAAVAGDTVEVADGVYATGGRVVYGVSNRLAVWKNLTVRAVNGPQVTIIRGQTSRGGSPGAVRCVYLTNGASLIGFTLTNGATASSVHDLSGNGGGVWCESTSAVVSNCVITGNSAYYKGGGAFRGTLQHCIMASNLVTYYGGGSADATVSDSTIRDNRAGSGGGVFGGTLIACVLTNNSATGSINSGGGASSATLFNCILAHNSAYQGGGVSDCTLSNCTLKGNSASRSGGGAGAGTLYNCILVGNSAGYFGGGACVSSLKNCSLTGNFAEYGGAAGLGTLDNCTLVSNSAFREGGGAFSATLKNCIIYYNTVGLLEENHAECTLAHCCTRPLPATAAGNLSADPQLASASHLSVGSPCRGAGSAAFASGVDIDGEAWSNPPSIGCDEYRAGAVTGPLSVSISALWTNVATGYPLDFEALIEGRVSASVWQFGDGTVVSNRPATKHAWPAPGVYAVVLRAYNESNPAGVSATTMVHVVSQVHYVAVGSASPTPPYTSWATAARNIQDAVDVASVTGALVLVSNGVYSAGGRAVFGAMTNRVVVNKPVVLKSTSGPLVTVIQGRLPNPETLEGGIRCVYLTNGAVLSGFTITNGATRAVGDEEQEQSGSGVWCKSVTALVSNCVIGGCGANFQGGGTFRGTVVNCTLGPNWGGYYGGGGACLAVVDRCIFKGNQAFDGGGARDCQLHNCVLAGNMAMEAGGGAHSSTLNNCTVVGNWIEDVGEEMLAPAGGGAFDCTLRNCIVCFNLASSDANYSESRLDYCCTTPLPAEGVGNISADPLFVDRANGNLRLQPNSPCIGAGLNDSAPGFTDLDGNHRIVDGRVDMGAYEFQTADWPPFISWLQQHGLRTDGSDNYTDPDGDRLNNWQEWRCGTVPTSALSVLRLFSPAPQAAHVTLRWQSVAGRSYFLDCCTNLTWPSRFVSVATNVPGQAGTTTFTHTNGATARVRVYRVGIR